MELLIVDPVTPSTLYAVTTQGTVFKSTDSAGSWNPVRGVTRVGFFAIDSRNTPTRYAASPTSGIFKSTDGGATWSASSNGLTHGASIINASPFIVPPDCAHAMALLRRNMLLMAELRIT